MQLGGKTALITGAGSGIGFATGLAFARRGFAVAAVDIDQRGLVRLEAAASEVGGRAMPIEADVSRWESLEKAFEVAESSLGALGIIHLNAGVNTGKPRFPASPRTRWERTLTIDLWAVLAGVQLAVASLRRAGGGVIVVTSSLAGVTAFPADPVYAAAKAGVIAMTHSLRFLQHDGIRVLCVCPGMVDTPLLRKRELTSAEEQIVRSIPLLQPDEIAQAIVALLDEDHRDASVFGLLPGRNPRPIYPQLDFPGDPSAVLQS